LEGLRAQGIDCFAVPHNSNVSNGWMFSEYEFLGNKMNARYARRQAANEPLFEISQTKGQSDAHPALSPNDEFADFELFDNLINLPIQADKSRGAFFRQGLATGMKLEKELGHNPYKMGVVAGADFHSGYQGNEEFDYLGGHGITDDTPQKRLNPKPGISGGVTAMLGTAGTTAVWADENTRAGIFDAMKRKETYGLPMEKIYDLAWSGKRKHGADGKLPAVGNTVDIKTATYTNDIGSTMLGDVWTDPDFDPTISAAYYVRVLEIPTPRWSTFDAVKLGVEPSTAVPATIQERAWSSPIWYTPPAKK
jgi:hypothetical protein